MALVAFLLMALAFGEGIRRWHHERRIHILQDTWKKAEKRAQQVDSSHHVIFVLGSSLVAHALGDEVVCPDSKTVFIPVDKGGIDFNLFDESNVLAEIQDKWSEAEIWGEARSFFRQNDDRPREDATVWERLLDTWLRPIGRGFESWWNSRMPHKQNPVRPGPSTIQTVDSLPYLGLERPRNRHNPTAEWAEFWATKLADRTIDRLLEIPTSPYTIKSNAIPEPEAEMRSAAHQIIWATEPEIVRFEKSFYFTHFKDTGHMNARGRDRFTTCLCDTTFLPEPCKKRK